MVTILYRSPPGALLVHANLHPRQRNSARRVRLRGTKMTFRPVITWEIPHVARFIYHHVVTFFVETAISVDILAGSFAWTVVLVEILGQFVHY